MLLMQEKREKCDNKFVPTGRDDWELELSGNCGETLQQMEALPPRKRRYIERRIRVLD